MTYEEACEETFSQSEALAEVREHGSDVDEFFEDCGNKSEYTGQEVLDWLGH